MILIPFTAAVQGAQPLDCRSSLVVQEFLDRDPAGRQLPGPSYRLEIRMVGSGQADPLTLVMFCRVLGAD